MEGVKLETGMWRWPEAGHTDTWLPHDPPQTMPWVREQMREHFEKICDYRPVTCVGLENLVRDLWSQEMDKKLILIYKIKR